MATIYELTEEFMQLLEMAEDPDVDQETLADTMEAIGGELEDKADGYAKVMSDLTGRMEAIKAEEERLNSRRKTIENNIKNMKKVLQNSMEATGKRKFKTDLFSFGIQKNPAAVVVDEPIENIPDKYLIPQDPKIDKQKIKEDLKAGIDIGIAHLEQSESLRIR